MERRDKMGRILHKNEYYLSKRGLYEYKYYDLNGERKSIYSFTLNSTDMPPKGKPLKPSLRELEKQIQKDLDENIDFNRGNKTTLNEYFREHIETRQLKDSTRENYKYMYKKYIKPTLGGRKIADIRYSEIRSFYHKLMTKNHLKANTLETIHTILHPIFETAIRDDIIRKNPTHGVMVEIKRSHNWVKPKRHALTEPQQLALMNFLATDAHYKMWRPLFTLLLGSGMRVGEAVGLRWEDCDFDKKIISVNHNLLYRRQDRRHKTKFYITTPKTKNSIREIPMFDEVEEALLEEKSLQEIIGPNTTVVDGYSGFIFRNRYGDCLSPHCVNRVIDRICEAYNKKEAELAEAEEREPILLPHFSVHQLRHTFCTRLCEVEDDLKFIQYVMGHADIRTTMDIYNEVTKEHKERTANRVKSKLLISKEKEIAPV